jgi:putative membrane protein
MPRLRHTLLYTALATSVILAAGCNRRDAPPAPRTEAPTSPAPSERSAPTPASRPAGGGATVTDADRAFVERAAIAGLAEVEITRHAIDKAADGELKRVAEQLHRDHQEAHRALMRIASSKGIAVPTAADGAKRAEIDQLRGLSGAELDRAVVEKLAASHRESIKVFAANPPGAQAAKN